MTRLDVIRERVHGGDWATMAEHAQEDFEWLLEMVDWLSRELRDYYNSHHECRLRHERSKQVLSKLEE